MNILLLGPQGSGRGTQARLLCEKYGFFYFESGAYLRKIAEKNLDLKKWLSEGRLVPDKEMTSYLIAFLDKENLYDDILFDGFPRTISQYNFLKIWLTERKVSLDLVVVLTLDEVDTIKRLSSRRTDPETGKIYNLITDPPPSNIDKTKLVQREDDKPESIQRRLGWYKDQVLPLIERLKMETKVIEIDGSRSIDQIQNDLVSLVEENRK